jgi:hypothetical protein
MPADPAFIYGPEDYFAFVESSDPLPKRGSTGEVTGLLRSERESVGLSEANRAVWVDCVESRYFMHLPWRDEICHVGNVVESEERRGQLNSIDRSKFVVGFLLLDARGDAERGTATELDRAAWHRITLEDRDGIPVVVGPDFDLEPDARRVRRLRYLGRCSELERKSLSNAFSLDFLPVARIGDRERDDPNSPPGGPKPSTGAQKKMTMDALRFKQGHEAPPEVLVPELKT